jgi:hypothetical protein
MVPLLGRASEREEGDGGGDEESGTWPFLHGVGVSGPAVWRSRLGPPASTCWAVVGRSMRWKSVR